ncbi:hypothetical protein PQX77_009533 [Marasmius sp. AFHP31]|nr:hypothetical protein PQX77_009533 [Marasmius sp. AFHP31]
MVEQLKALREDPADVTAAILKSIVAREPTQVPQLTPTSSDIIINTLWSLSLLLSISSALAGLLCGISLRSVAAKRESSPMARPLYYRGTTFAGRAITSTLCCGLSRALSHRDQLALTKAVAGLIVSPGSETSALLVTRKGVDLIRMIHNGIVDEKLYDNGDWLSTRILQAWTEAVGRLQTIWGPWIGGFKNVPYPP